MKNMFISSNKKNPLINCERNQLKHQNPQILLSPKISLKCMKKCMKNEIKPKRKGRMVLPMLDDKNREKKLRENDKKLSLNLDRSKRERERE